MEDKDKISLNKRHNGKQQRQRSKQTSTNADKDLQQDDSEQQRRGRRRNVLAKVGTSSASSHSTASVASVASTRREIASETYVKTSNTTKLERNPHHLCITPRVNEVTNRICITTRGDQVTNKIRIIPRGDEVEIFVRLTPRVNEVKPSCTTPRVVEVKPSCTTPRVEEVKSSAPSGTTPRVDEVKPSRTTPRVEEVKSSPLSGTTPRVDLAKSRRTTPCAVEIKKSESDSNEPTTSRSIKPKPTMKTCLQATSKPVITETDSNNNEKVTSLQNPLEGIETFNKKICSSDWEEVVEALHILAQLSTYHQQDTKSELNKLVVKLIDYGVNSLRTHVVRAACEACIALSQGYKKTLDLYVETIGNSLILRTGDTNKFMRAEANKALDTLVVYSPPNRVANIIALRGSGHKNVLVRATASRLLTALATKIGPQAVLELSKEVRDKLLLSGAQFLVDANLEARNSAKIFFRSIKPLPSFMRTLQSAVPSDLRSRISKILNTL